MVVPDVIDDNGEALVRRLREEAEQSPVERLVVVREALLSEAAEDEPQERCDLKRAVRFAGAGRVPLERSFGYCGHRSGRG